MYRTPPPRSPIVLATGSGLRALDPTSGRVLWSRVLGPCHALRVLDNYVYTAHTPSKSGEAANALSVSCFEAQSGAPRWSTPTEIRTIDAALAHLATSSPMLVVSPQAVVVAVPDLAIGLDPASGQLLWEHSAQVAPIHAIGADETPPRAGN